MYNRRKYALGERRTDMDFKKNRHYFEPINWLVTIIFTIISIALLYFYIWIGIILLLGIGSYIFLKYWYRPTFEDIDAVFDEQISTAVQKGFEKLGLVLDEVNEMDPVIIHGPMLDAFWFKPAVRKGKDQKIRSSNYQVTVFFFSKQQMYLYHHSFSIIDDEKNEWTDEYLYQDLVSISTSSTVTTFYDSIRKVDDIFNLEALQLTTRAGTTIACSIQDFQSIENTIRDMRSLFRSKRSSTHSY